MQSDRVRDSLNARVASIVFDFSGILSSSATFGPVETESVPFL
jgi:hypothetical protein